MDEGLWHIRRRNESWQANDFAAACGREPDPRDVLRAGARHAVVRGAGGQPLAGGAAARMQSSGGRRATGVHQPCGAVSAVPVAARGILARAAGLRAGARAGRPRVGRRRVEAVAVAV